MTVSDQKSPIPAHQNKISGVRAIPRGIWVLGFVSVLARADFFPRRN
jgi:hypothetical protein